MFLNRNQYLINEFVDVLNDKYIVAMPLGLAGPNISGGMVVMHEYPIMKPGGPELRK